MRLFYGFDSASGAKLVRTDVMDLSWLENIRQQDMSKIRGESDTRVPMSGTITFHLRIDELRTCITSSVLDKLVVSVLLGTMFISRLIKSFHLSEREMVPYHSPLVPMLTVQEARSAAKKSKLGIRQEQKCLALLVTLIESKPNNITVA